MIQINKKKGFTLVELLAVIVILAIILVIAVPKVMSIIEDAKMGTLESTAKMIASQAEKQKVQNTVLGNEGNITCEGITNINKEDYPNCEITFEGNIAKVTIVGGGKFDGLYVCGGTKTDATATKDGCTQVVNPVSFADDDWATIVAAVQSGNYPYEVGNEKTIDLGDGLGTTKIRVANTTPCSEVSVDSKTACGFVLEFTEVIDDVIMNQVDADADRYGINIGGWPAAEAYEYVNETIYNAFPEELRNGIIDTYVVSGHGSSDTGERADGNFESTDKLYLLSPEEVYGTSFNDDTDTSVGTSRQLDYYATYVGEGYTGVSMTNYEGANKVHEWGCDGYWWLRSAFSTGDEEFFYVDTGQLSRNYSYSEIDGPTGVSPAFRLSN